MYSGMKVNDIHFTICSGDVPMYWYRSIFWSIVIRQISANNADTLFFSLKYLTGSKTYVTEEKKSLHMGYKMLKHHN